MCSDNFALHGFIDSPFFFVERPCYFVYYRTGSSLPTSLLLLLLQVCMCGAVRSFLLVWGLLGFFLFFFKVTTLNVLAMYLSVP